VPAADDLALVAGFLREHAVRTAGRIEPLPWGVAVFNDELPRVWDLNVLWVAEVPHALTAEALAAAADRLQGGAGLAHRHVLVTDEEGGGRIAAGMRARGWSVRRYVVMVHRGEPDRAADLSAVREVDEPTIRAFTEANLRADPGGASEETIRQLLGQKRVAAHAGARFFAVEVHGVVASGCDLYTDGRVAQIESVMTLPGHRNQGLSRAVVLRALAEARAAGHDVVFLLAEADDWPRELYARLGFQESGFTHVFTRTPDPPV
jgi:N-acetylglutamate synthase-like GNAT family acetyltransferase